MYTYQLFKDNKVFWFELIVEPYFDYQGIAVLQDCLPKHLFQTAMQYFEIFLFK